MAIDKISEAVWRAILRKSPASLPDNPTARGWSASEIKAALYRFLLDDKESFKAVIEGLITEINDMEAELKELIQAGGVDMEAVKALIEEALKDYEPGTGTGGGGSVTVTVDGGTGTASHNSIEIYNLIQADNIVVAVVPDANNYQYQYGGAIHFSDDGACDTVEFYRTVVDESGKATTEYIYIYDDKAAEITYNEAESGGVTSVNGKTGAITLNATDVGADPSGTAATAVSDHNIFTGSHNDIRILIQELSDRLNAFFDTDDTTLDELSEIVAYITSNKSLIDSITTSKVSVSDITDNLTTNVSNKPLSAAQGVALKSLIDALSTGKLDTSALTAAKLASVLGYTPANAANVPTTLSQLTGDSTHRTVTDAEKEVWNNKADSDDIVQEVYIGEGTMPVGTVLQIVYEEDDEPEDGYTLTAADKAEIAELVDGATVVQAPKYVNSVDEMTDTSRVYVMASTGRIWAYMDTASTSEVTVTDEIVGTSDNPYEVGRLSSSGTVSTDVSGYVVSPYIDLTKEAYAGKTIQLHFEGLPYITETAASYTQHSLFGTDKTTVVYARSSSTPNKSESAFAGITGITTTINGTTSAVLEIPIPAMRNGTQVGYMRFSAAGVEANSNIYITYTDTQTVEGGQWVDTGTSYSPALTDAEKTAIAEEAASLIDAQLLSVIGSGEVSV